MTRVLTKSGRGLREAAGKTQELSGDLRDVLKLCKGQFDLDDLLACAEANERGTLALALDYLFAKGYLREIVELRAGETESDAASGGKLVELTPGQTLLAGEVARRLMAEGDDAAVQTADTPAGDGVTDTDARLERMRRVRDEVREQARREAEEKARAEEAARLQREAEEALRREEEERARRAEEERQRREAEEQARRREAEEQARREAEERARQAAIEKARREAEERARREEEERLRREAEERARLEAEERARREAAERERREAEKQAKREAEERERRRRARRKRNSMTAGAVVVVVALLAAALFVLQWIPLSGKRAEMEQLASNSLGIPVKVGSARVSLFSGIGWILDDVKLGEGGNATIGRVVVGMSAGDLFSATPRIRSLELDEFRMSWEALAKGLIDESAQLPLASGNIVVRSASITGGGLALPVLTARLEVGEGKLQSVTASGADAERGNFELSAKPAEAGWAVEAQLRAEKITLPVGLALPFNELKVTGVLRDGRFDASEVVTGMPTGEVNFAGTLAWGNEWLFNAKFLLRSVDMNKLAPKWFRGGFVRIEGDASARAPSLGELWKGLQAGGALRIPSGELAGIDFGRVLERRGMGEQTYFEEIEGRMFYDGQRIDIPRLSIYAKNIVGQGSLGITVDQQVNGRLNLEMRGTAVRISTSLGIGGSVEKPGYSH